MHTRLFSLLFFVLAASSLCAQRYLTAQFADIARSTYTYAVIGADTLQLDLYQSPTDTNTRQPLLLYVHGGGFSGGTRDGGEIPDFARYLAQRGYAVVSMSYRLTMRGQSFGCDQPAATKIATFLSVVQDIYAATQFVIKQQGDWGIDPARIVLAGSSAGAEAVLQAAYWPREQLPKNTVALPTGFRYAGVISMAGALVDSRHITRQSAIPTLLFHGTCDNLVPYATAAHHYCAPGQPGYLVLHGAKTIADRLAQLGQPYYLFTICQGRHEWASQPMTDYPQHFAEFMWHDVLQGEFRQVHEVIRQAGSDCDYFESPFPVCR